MDDLQKTDFQKADYQASETQKKIVMTILESIIPDYQVWVFGSRLKGATPKAYSDLDLAVLNKDSLTGLSLELLAELREAFDESDLPWKVDVVNYAGVSEEFKAIIKSNHAQISNNRT